MKDRPLNNLERELVSDNHNLINFCLKKYNLNYDDYYGLMAIELCRAARGYNPDKGKFTTLAVKYIENMVYKDYKEKKKRENILNTISINTYSNNNSILEIIDKSILNIDSEVSTLGLYDSLITHFSKRSNGDKYLKVVKMLSEGRLQKEIAIELGVSQQRIAFYKKEIKNYLKNEII